MQTGSSISEKGKAMPLDANALIAALGLKPLAGEGGLYAETYRSRDEIAAAELSERFAGGARSCGTAIYFMLTDEPDCFSALHRLKGDEIYHFYLGDPVELLLLRPDGGRDRVVLGPDVLHGQQVQFMVPGGCWQGSRLAPGGKFALMGTTMAPGFDLRDNEPGQRAELLAQYPAAREEILRLTREGAWRSIS
jgi:uncharacterized protein